jgi:ABC-2 type transport system ATP-binding protein
MVELVDVCKRFGHTLALDRVSAAIPPGGVVGLVGVNGSGKTTLLSILAGLMRPSSGSVVGVTPGPDVAFLPEQSLFEPWLSCRELVELSANLGRRRVDAAKELASLGLGAEADRRFGSLSKGTRQRAALASAFVRRAPVTLLDEPLSGVDPVSRRLVIQRIADAGQDGTIVFSSHRLDDVVSISDHLLVLSAGHLLFTGTPEELRQDTSAETTYVIEIRGDCQRLADLLLKQGWVSRAAVEGIGRVRFSAVSADAAEQGIVALLNECGASLVRFHPLESKLEDLLTDLLL